MPKSPYQLHVEEWQGCTLCDLHERRNKVVLARGSLPCDVLFVGEAPGHSEDVIGRPFVGPSGRLLDSIVSRAFGMKYRVAFTNVVACIPLGDGGDKVEEPEAECVEACEPRLTQLGMMARPRLVVAVGATARGWLEPGYKHSLDLGVDAPVVNIDHPAAILRAPEAARGLMMRRCVITLTTAAEDYLEQGKVPLKRELVDDEDIPF